MAVVRHLSWDGCFNVRDLGGLPTTDGRLTCSGTVVRADGLNRLTTAGWAALWAHGIRAVVDLRNDDELLAMPDVAARPAGLTTVHVPLDDIADTAFWEHCWSNQLDGSPLYYQPFLDRKPERCAAAVAAIARAEPGGVVFHCGAGRDRTGLISLLLLALVGVEPEAIVADYELSHLRLGPFWAARGEADQRPLREAILARTNTTARALLLAILASFDVAAYLRSGGLSDDDLTAIRARLLGPVVGSTAAGGIAPPRARHRRVHRPGMSVPLSEPFHGTYLRKWPACGKIPGWSRGVRSGEAGAGASTAARVPRRARAGGRCTRRPRLVRAAADPCTDSAVRRLPVRTLRGGQRRPPRRRVGDTHHRCRLPARPRPASGASFNRLAPL